MTTFVRSWTTSYNNVPIQTTLDAQGKAVLRAWKNNFKSAGWTVAGSSCGGVATVNGAGGSKTITAGSPVTLTDAAAAFTSDMVGRNLVIASAVNGGNNGTFVITAVTSGTTLQYTNGSAVTETNTTFTWSIQAAAGIDGVDRWTGDADLVWAAGGVAHSWIILQSPTNYPSAGKTLYMLISCATGATSQHQYLCVWATQPFTAGSTTVDPTSPTNLKSLGTVQFLKSTVTNSKYHLLWNTTGDVICFCSQDGTGIVQAFNAVLLTTGFESGDLYPAWFAAGYSAVAPGGFDMSTINGAGKVGTFWIDGTPITNSGALVYILNGIDIFGTFTSAGSSNTGKYPDAPILIASPTASKIAFRGALVDVAYGPYGTGVTEGTVEPSSGSTTTTLMGSIWVPNGNVTPSL